MLERKKRKTTETVVVATGILAAGVERKDAVVSREVVCAKLHLGSIVVMYSTDK